MCAMIVHTSKSTNGVTMIKLIDQHVSKLAIAVLVGGISLALSGCAGDTIGGTTASAQHQASPRVEKRIQTLHDKLEITAAQEPQWQAVADVIRGNEANVHELAEQRHATEGASAVDDLKSYQKIADAHAAGLEKLIPVFEDLYSTMSPQQKTNADALFSKYEGHEGHKNHKNKAAKQG
jgi:hypothetical protein